MEPSPLPHAKPPRQRACAGPGTYSAGGELVTLVTGAEVADGLADGVVKAVHDRHPEVDTVVYDGGQPRYPLLLGVE